MSNLYARVLKKIEDPQIPRQAVALLQNPSPEAQEAAVDILIKKPSAAALDELWKLRRSLEGNEDHVFFRFEVERALGACVRLAPEWLQSAIFRADPSTEPFGVLVYMLAQLENVEGGEEVWRSVRESVLQKLPQRDKRALAYAVESFGDRESLYLLRQPFQNDKDLLAPAALRAFAYLSPEEVLQELEKAPLEFELLLGRSWWLPQLLALQYKRTSEILRRKIEIDPKPWFAAGVYDSRENLITSEILDLLLEETGKRLTEALSAPEPNKDPLARPFDFLADVSRLDLLENFETNGGTRFEEDLTEYLIRQGPNDEGWHRWSVENGISLLQKIGGEGFTRIANLHLRDAKTRLGIRDGLLLGIRRPNDETLSRVVEIARDPQRGGQKENGFPLVQFEAVKAMAALGLWKEMVEGVLRLGLQVPRDLPEHVEGHIFTDDELTEVLEEIRSGEPSPGGILMLGFSGRSEFVSELHNIYKRSERESDHTHACLLALEALEDRGSDDLFIDNLSSPKSGWVAVRALLGSVRSDRGNEALLRHLQYIKKSESGARPLLAMNLLIREETRERAAQILWQQLEPHELLFYTGDTIQYLACLKQPEVQDFLREAALADPNGVLHGADQYAAIEGVAEFDPSFAFDAALALFRSDDHDRVLSPETLLKLNEGEAHTVFKDTLATTEDFLVIAAIGEALDRRQPEDYVRAWLEDKNSKLRQGVCFMAGSLKWSSELEKIIIPLLQDRNWDVRAAARSAFEALRLSQETTRLVEAVTQEGGASRRWVLVDAALKIGYPGVVSGYGAHSWFGRMCQGLPYVLRKHAVSRLEEKRKKFREDLAKRERS